MKGKQKSARDMILSLGVIVLAAGVIWIFIPHDDGEPDVKRVDYRVELLTAQRAASYPVAAPEGLSEDWNLGFRTPDGEYGAVEQSTKKPSTFIRDASQGGQATERTEEIGGRTW